MAKRGFLDGYKTYDTSRGFGTPTEWRAAFNDTMGIDEAKRHVGKQSPWKMLGISMNAPWNSVVSAYRKMAFKTHPDRATANGMTIEAATEQFKLVTAAFTVLKRQYNQ